MTEEPGPGVAKRASRRLFAGVAALGGMAALVVAAVRGRPAARPAAPAGSRPAAPATAGGRTLPVVQGTSSVADVAGLERHYALSTVIGGKESAVPFRRSLGGLSVGPDDQVVALGDGEVRVFDGAGRLLQHWAAPEQAQAVGVAADGTVYVGGAGRVDIFAAEGQPRGGFRVGESAEPASISAVQATGGDILVADASARIVRRLDASGRAVNLIGTALKTKSFLLPNGSMDLAVDAAGHVLATDTGRHQVTIWSLDGALVGRFGKFGMLEPADFVGCCNPVNVAATPDGKVVTAEKMVARVKVFELDGTLIGYIGPDHFDPMCTHIYLGVDRAGRILAGDPVRRQILVFSSKGNGR
jgi:hypothetical protein